VVATETSAVTVISVPGLAARGDLTFLQIAFGYLVGRIGVAKLLLPGYFEGTQDTAYQRLERRFGSAARRTASGVFLVTRALADCVRIFATAIPLALITYGSPTDKALAIGILAIGIVTLLYTWVGGLRAVVWVDVIQLGVYLLGGIATLIVAMHLAGGVGGFARAWDAGKLAVLDFRPSFKILFTSWGGLVGGALLPAAPHATDHLLVPRPLPPRAPRAGQLALSIASLTYGSLLGTYILGGAWQRTRQIDVIVAIVGSVIVMSPVVLGAVIPHFPLHWLPGLSWWWYVPLGTAVTVLVGMISSLVSGRWAAGQIGG